MTTYILSQIFTVFVYIFLGLTYCVKQRKWVLTFSFLSNFFCVIAFILLKAYTSAAMCAICIVRDTIFIIDEKRNGKTTKITKKDVAILLLVYAMSIIAIISTFKGFWSLMYAIGTLLFTYAIWQKNNKTYRLLGIPATFLGVMDAIYIKSIMGTILQSVVLICSTVGYFSHKDEKIDEMVIKNEGEVFV